MATMDQEEDLRQIADALTIVLRTIYQEPMGFFLCISPQNERGENVADYIANCDRESGIEWLRDTADRLEGNQSIGASQGEA